jgi:hypothetical protein
LALTLSVVESFGENGELGEESVLTLQGVPHPDILGGVEGILSFITYLGW